jgi:predicted aspartyl protease
MARIIFAAAVTAVAAVLAMSNPAPAKAGQAPPAPVLAGQPNPIADFAIALDRYLRMTVPVTIAGVGPFRFLIDTGAQATVVTDRVADRLLLVPTGRALLVAMGSSRMVETIELDGLEFANRRLDGLTAPLLEARHVGADGILGLDSLQNLRVLMDFRQNSISVADAHDDRATGYEIVVRARRKLGQMIITDARIDGVRTAIIIDTGAAGSHGNAALRRRLGARHHAELFTTDVNGFELRSDLTFAGTLRIGGMTMTRVPIGYADSPVFAQLGLDDRPALILGMRSLRAFDRVAIDFADRRILFDLPDGVEATPATRQIFYPSRIGS